MSRPCEICGCIKFKTASKAESKYACRKCGTIRVDRKEETK